jgi:hypothetical protein
MEMHRQGFCKVNEEYILIVTFLDPPVERGQRIPERVFGCTYGLYPIPNIFLLYSAAVLEDRGGQRMEC